MSDAADRLTRSWSSVATDLLTVATAGCRSFKDLFRRRGPETFPVTLDPTCRPASTGPGAVRVRVRVRRQSTGIVPPVVVHQAVPNRVPLFGPRPVMAPQQITAGHDHVEVSIDPQLAVGLYLGRLDDAQGGGTPYVIYLDGLP